MYGKKDLRLIVIFAYEISSSSKWTLLVRDSRCIDVRGDGVGIVAVTADSTGKSSVLYSMGSILISYPLAAPENCKTFEKDDAMHTEIEMLSKNYIDYKIFWLITFVLSRIWLLALASIFSHNY